MRAAVLLMGWRWLVEFGQKVSSRVWAVIWVEQLMLFFCPAGWPDVPLLALLGFCPAKILFLGLTIYLIASVQQTPGGAALMLRMPKTTFHNLVPPGLYL